MLKVILASAAAMAALALSNAHAGAEPLSPVDNSIAKNHAAVCQAYDNYGPGVTETLALALISTDDDLSIKQAAEVIVRSVVTYCPEHQADLQAFVQSRQA